MLQTFVCKDILFSIFSLTLCLVFFFFLITSWIARYLVALWGKNTKVSQDIIKNWSGIVVCTYIPKPVPCPFLSGLLPPHLMISHNLSPHCCHSSHSPSAGLQAGLIDQELATCDSSTPIWQLQNTQTMGNDSTCAFLGSGGLLHLLFAGVYCWDIEILDERLKWSEIVDWDQTWTPHHFRTLSFWPVDFIFP